MENGKNKIISTTVRLLQIIAILIAILILCMTVNQLRKQSVEAAEIESNLKITEVAIVSIEDGTPDWDVDDNPGNDSGPSNGIVRSFDTITYKMAFNINKDNSALPSFTKGSALITAEIEVIDHNGNPLTNSDGMPYAVWDTSVLDEEYVTLENNNMKFIYIMKDLEPGGAAYTMPIKVKAYAIPNGGKIRAKLTIKEGDNSTQTPIENTTSWTTISARTAVNIELGETSNGLYPRMEISGQDGRVTENHIGLYLHNDKPSSQDLKGLQFVKGDITFDIRLHYKYTNEASPRPNAGDSYVYDFGLNGKAENVSTGEYGIYAFYNAYNPGGQGIGNDECYDSGNISVVQEGDILHVKMSDYKFTDVFPNIGWWDAIPIDSNKGWFIADALRMFVPLYGVGYDVLYTLSVENIKITGTDDVVVTTNTLAPDDAITNTILERKPGNFHAYTLAVHQDTQKYFVTPNYFSANAVMTPGQVFENEFFFAYLTDPSDGGLYDLMKFDQNVFELIPFDDTGKMYTTKEGYYLKYEDELTVKYGVGSWSAYGGYSLEENMNRSDGTELDWYNTYEDAKAAEGARKIYLCN